MGYLTPETVGKRWMYWGAAMVPFLFGMNAATNSESDPKTRANIRFAQVWTVFSWCTYPIVFIILMFGCFGSYAIVGIQIGYCISDIISKCGVGLLICHVTLRKSDALKIQGGLNTPLLK